jgi:hypothetical protein
MLRQRKPVEFPLGYRQRYLVLRQSESGYTRMRAKVYQFVRSGDGYAHLAVDGRLAAVRFDTRESDLKHPYAIEYEAELFQLLFNELGVTAVAEKLCIVEAYKQFNFMEAQRVLGFEPIPDLALPKPPKPPIGRLIREGGMFECPKCRSTMELKWVKWLKFQKKCINPECGHAQ